MKNIKNILVGAATKNPNQDLGVGSFSYSPESALTANNWSVSCQLKPAISFTPVKKQKKIVLRLLKKWTRR